MVFFYNHFRKRPFKILSPKKNIFCFLTPIFQSIFSPLFLDFV
ncbi:Hypothetical Protein SLY_0021 [Strawberry lethal yellows phytoplasma (CPA) str. NZSb11]|uniref:Uncharacterized protein n=1 Tax=Strawberry lethal yellows phytoplasma (CPA) str. NZSb11 TaxID=980422 RepID=R4RVT9_PHYAS|nr:Hypothetical Protein SLY_0021 [Strawberry lethal yellows phytoplasma (CPA) str. NZSb11]